RWFWAGGGADWEDRADIAVGLAGGEPAQDVLLARGELPLLRGRPAGAAERGAEAVEGAEVRADEIQRVALGVIEASSAAVEDEAHQQPLVDVDRHGPQQGAGAAAGAQ